MKLLCALVVVVGCSGKEGKPIDQVAGTGSSSTAAPGSAVVPSAGTFSGALVEIGKYKDKMCACTDVACTDGVFKEFTAWRLEFRKSAGTTKPTPEQDKTGNELNRALMNCRMEVARNAGKGSGSAAGSGSASADPVEAALGELDGFKTRMCACTDKACGDKLQAEYATWQRNLRTKMSEKPNKLQEIRGNALEKEMKACRTKAETATPGAPGGTSKIDNFLTQMQGYRDKICACTAKDCAAKLQTELETWLGNAAKEIADAKPTKDQDDKADRLEREMKDCVTKLK